MNAFRCSKSRSPDLREFFFGNVIGAERWRPRNEVETGRIWSDGAKAAWRDRLPASLAHRTTVWRHHRDAVGITIYITDIQLVLELRSSIPFSSWRSSYAISIHGHYAERRDFTGACKTERPTAGRGGGAKTWGMLYYTRRVYLVFFFSFFSGTRTRERGHALEIANAGEESG